MVSDPAFKDSQLLKSRSSIDGVSHHDPTILQSYDWALDPGPH